MSKTREIISLHFGQTGIRIGDYCSQLFADEHKINSPQETQSPFFYKNSKNNSVPNSIFVDLDPFSISRLRRGKSAGLYDESSFLSGVEDGGNNYARSYHLINESLIDDLMEKIRLNIEKKSSIQGFLVTHSTGGGTGSGFVSRIMENVNDTYKNMINISFSVLPGEDMSRSPMEVYNTLLFLHSTMDNFDVSFVFDNDAIKKLCETKYKVNNVEFKNINEMVAQTISSITASLRFGGEVNKLLKEFPSTIAPYRNLKFPIPAYAPLVTDAKMSVTDVSLDILKEGNQLVKANCLKSNTLACCYLYRGAIQRADAMKTVNFIKSKNLLNFAPVPLCKANVIKQRATCLPDSMLPQSITQANVCALINGSAICDVFNPLLKTYQRMRKGQSYVHWFVQEGLEEQTFVEAENTIKNLNKDYQETLSAKDI